MPDAEVIPLGTRGRPGRGSARRGTPSAASRSLATGAAGVAASNGRGRRGTAPAARAARRPERVERAGVDPAVEPAEPVEPVEPVEAGAAEPGLVEPEVGGPRVTPAAVRAGAREQPPDVVGGPLPDNADEPPPGAPRGARRSPEDAGAESALVDLARMLGEIGEEVLGEDAQRRLADGVRLLRRRLTGDFGVDDFGYDPELTDDVLLPLLRPLYQRWFRVEVRGLDNVPAEGGALVVGNHSGAIAFDSLMTQVALRDEHPAHRTLRALAADFVFRTPVLGELARKSGATLACTEDAELLLRAGEVVGVWPEGFKGIGKPFRERYKLQRFGRGGFVSAAVRTGAPIVPVSIVGAEETYPIIGDMPTLARLLGVPYIPVTPTFPWLGLLGAIPLPSKWIIEFGTPVETDRMPVGAGDDPMLVFNITDQVRETIQQTLYALLVSRRRTFF